MSDCWTAHFWVRTQQGIIFCQRCGVLYTQPWTAVDAPCRVALAGSGGQERLLHVFVDHGRITWYDIRSHMELSGAT